MPSDLATKWTQVTLPIDGKAIAVGIRDEVTVSLRTRDPRLAKDRFAQANAALARQWQAIRARL